jgi:hypothetical protein
MIGGGSDQGEWMLMLRLHRSAAWTARPCSSRSRVLSTSLRAFQTPFHVDCRAAPRAESGRCARQEPVGAFMGSEFVETARDSDRARALALTALHLARDQCRVPCLSRIVVRSLWSWSLTTEHFREASSSQIFKKVRVSSNHVIKRPIFSSRNPVAINRLCEDPTAQSCSLESQSSRNK